jgi:hypothetical protein
VYPQVSVLAEQAGAQQFGKLACGRAPHQIHLEKAFLTV